MKKVRMIALFLTLAMMLSLCAAAAGKDVLTDRERAINVLLQSGWTMEEIDDLLTDEAILAYKDALPVEVSEKKYYRVTEEAVYEITAEECQTQLEAIEQVENQNTEPGVAPMAVIPDDGYGETEVTTTDGYLTYYVMAHNVGNGHYVLSARYEWLKDPRNRKIDIFGLGHSEQLTQVGNATNVYYIYKCDVLEKINTNIRQYTLEDTSPNEIFVDDGGTVVKQQLMVDVVNPMEDNTNYVYASHHRGYIQYEVEVNSDSATAFSIQAEYYHQEWLVTLSPGISYPLGGTLSLSSGTGFKRMSPNPYLSFEK